MGDARSFYVRAPNYLVSPNLRPVRYGQNRVTRRKTSKGSSSNIMSQMRVIEDITTNPTRSLLNMKTGKVRWSIFSVLTTAIVVGYIVFLMLYIVPWLNNENLSKEDDEYSVILALTVFTLAFVVYRMITNLMMMKTRTLPLDIMVTMVTVGFTIVRLTWLLDNNMRYEDPRRVIFVVEAWITVIVLSIIAFMTLLLGFTVGGDLKKIRISK